MNKLLLSFVLVLALWVPVQAAEPLPGDACSGANNLQFTSGPEVAGGGGHALLCQGGTWKPILSFSGTAGLTRLGNQTCATNEILKFNGTSWACAADASGMSGLPALTSANIWVGNGSNAAAPVTISGDAVLSNSGILTLGSDVVSTTNIVNGTIARADLADSIINSSAIADGQVTGTDIAATTITNANIANATIVATTKLSATGTKSSSTFLRGDNTWAAPGGFGSTTTVSCTNSSTGRCIATCSSGWSVTGCAGFGGSWSSSIASVSRPSGNGCQCDCSGACVVVTCYAFCAQ